MFNKVDDEQKDGMSYFQQAEFARRSSARIDNKDMDVLKIPDDGMASAMRKNDMSKGSNNNSRAEQQKIVI